MRTYSNSIVVKFDTSENGNSGSGKLVTVFNTGTQTKANLFNVDLQSIDNPVQADDNGNYTFNIDDGYYDIHIDYGLATQTSLINQQIFEITNAGGTGGVITFQILADAIASTDLSVGGSFDLVERSAGNGGGAMWDLVLASGVTPNAFNIVQCTGIPALAAVLRTQNDLFWSDAAEWGAVDGDNIDGLIASIVAQEGGNAAIELPVGDFFISETITIDIKGQMVIEQGTSDRPFTIIRQTDNDKPIIVITKANQILENFAATYDLTGEDLKDYPNAIGIDVPAGTARPHCRFSNIDLRICFAGLRMNGSIFGTHFDDVRTTYCQNVAIGDGSDFQTALTGSIKANRCFNGFSVPKLVYCNLSFYFDHCGIGVDVAISIQPTDDMPILLECDIWRGVNITYLGVESSPGILISLKNYSQVSVLNTHYVPINVSDFWTIGMGGNNRDGVIPLDEQALIRVENGGLSMNNFDLLLFTSAGYPAPETVDTPLVYQRVAGGTNSGVEFLNSNIDVESYKLRSTTNTTSTLAEYGYDGMQDSIYIDERLISKSPTSRLITSWYDGLAWNKRKPVVTYDHTDNGNEYISNLEYVVTRTISSGGGLSNTVNIPVSLQSAVNIGATVTISITDTEYNSTTNTTVSCVCSVTSLSTLGSVVPLSELGCTVAKVSNDIVVTKSVGNFKEDKIIKVGVVSKNKSWNNNPANDNVGRDVFYIDPTLIV